MSGSAGVGGGDAGTCDTSKSPVEESCLVSDEHAVFASGGGSGGDGTQSAPYGSLSDAMTAAKAAGKVVVACADGAFTAKLELNASHSGVKVYGGFDCTTWASSATARTVVAPSDKGYALEADGVKGTSFEGFEFRSKNGTAAGESSIAAFLKDSTLAVKRVQFVAGVGAAGAHGVTASVTYPAQAALNGNDASVTAAGAEKTCTCPGGATTTGGLGGAPSGAGQSGTAGLPNHGNGQGGTGSCGAGGTGKDGADAPSGAPAAGAAVVGTLTAGGFSGAKGGNATPGAPGQGGGGGASVDTTGGGGGGGCGGCGGAAGQGGGAGGSSIALLLWNSSVTGTQLDFLTGAAGAGGNGSAGQTGQQTFGNGGLQAGGACSGGKGGKGGGGGPGGGGAGGVSVGVVHDALSQLTATATTYVQGNAGAKGNGGVASNDGVPGVKQDTLQL